VLLHLYHVNLIALMMMMMMKGGYRANELAVYFSSVRFISVHFAKKCKHLQSEFSSGLFLSLLHPSRCLSVPLSVRIVVELHNNE